MQHEGIEGYTLYQACQCLGCEVIRFRCVSWDTECVDIEESLYPSTIEGTRAPIDSHEFPEIVGTIYGETVRAFNAGALILAGGGLRAIVEAICKHQQVAGGNLQHKIDALVQKGLLAKPQADLLHEERYLGNDALHEVESPAQKDIEDGLTIVEVLLNTIYVLPNRAKSLQVRRIAKAAKKTSPATKKNKP